MLKKDLQEFSAVFQDIKEKCPIIVAGDRNNYNAMMVNWGGFGHLWNKRVAFIFIRKSRYTYEFLEKYPNFTINFVDLNPTIMKTFGSLSGRDIDKFAATGLHPCLDIDKNLYSISEANQVLKCTKLLAIDLTKASFVAEDIVRPFYAQDEDLHILYIAEIKEYLVKE